MNDNNSYNGDKKTILTKALYGRGSQLCQDTVYIYLEDDIEPKQVLGCFISDAKIYTANLENLTHEYIDIRIEGKFNVHIWYEVDGNTSISNIDSKFSQIVSLKNLDGKSQFREDDLTKSVRAWVQKSPVCLGTMIVNKSGVPAIAVQIEYELAAEVFEESRMDIVSYKPKKIKAYIEEISDSDITFFDKFFNSDYETDDVDYEDCD